MMRLHVAMVASSSRAPKRGTVAGVCWIALRNAHVRVALRALVAVAVLAAAPQVAAADRPRFDETPLKAPECVSDASDYFYAETEENANSVPALSHFYFVARHLAPNPLHASPTADFGALPSDYPEPGLRDAPLTGFTPPHPYSRWQRSASVGSTADVASAVQLHCLDAGSFINSWTFPYRAIPAGGAHTAYAYDFKLPGPEPLFYDPGAALVLEVSVEVPWIARWPSAASGHLPVGQVSLFAYLHDQRNRKAFAAVFLIFDNRLGIDGTFEPYVADDLRTPFVSTTIGSSARYATASPASASATGVPWRGLRLFRVHVTQSDFRRMVDDVNAYCAGNPDAPHCSVPLSRTVAFSTDVRDYAIASFGVLHEVFRTPDSNISMGVHYHALGAWTLR